MHVKLSNLLAALLLGLFLVAPAAAGAQSIPPGNSGVDEYTEGTPGLGGEQHNPPGGGSQHNPPGSGSGEAGSPDVLPAATAAALEAAGPAGQGVAAMVDQTSPGTKALKDAASADSSTSADSSASQSGAGAEGSSGGGGLPLSAIADAASGSSGGLGDILPILLIVSALLTGVALFRGSRGPT